MLMFPLEFVPVPEYPGYVWNVKELQLYTYKLGSLRKLPLQRPNPWNLMQVPFYAISHLGKRHKLLLSRLQNLSQGYAVDTVPHANPQQTKLFD
jgi:hypothetical protein